MFVSLPYSALHDGRPVIIVAGSNGICDGCYSVAKTAEVFDFTKEGATWQESKVITFLYILILLLTVTHESR